MGDTPQYASGTKLTLADAYTELVPSSTVSVQVVAACDDHQLLVDQRRAPLPVSVVSVGGETERFPSGSTNPKIARLSSMATSPRSPSPLPSRRRPARNVADLDSTILDEPVIWVLPCANLVLTPFRAPSPVSAASHTHPKEMYALKETTKTN